MPAAAPLGVVEDPRYREHEGPPGHPERPGRLVAVGEAIAARSAHLARRSPRQATDEELLAVHDRALLARVTAATRRAPAHLDPDTFVSSESLTVARLAAGGAIDLARAVARGELRGGFAAVRPPGHHAEAGRAMGFCLFNNVAIAARALQREEGVGKILIFDWDVHHGNGTQHSFDEDPSILYLSTHQFPYYPGTGDAREIGRGRGEGATVNVPMPAGCGNAEYVAVVERVFAPVARAFRPDVILVSCGFDTHRDDPLASMDVTGEGFLAMTRIVRDAAEELCDGRLCFVLEGGYAPSGLVDGAGAVLDALLEPEAPPAQASEAPAGSLARAVVERVVAVHGRRFPGLGAAD